jgi:hypothetical protein
LVERVPPPNPLNKGILILWKAKRRPCSDKRGFLPIFPSKRGILTIWEVNSRLKN